MRERMKKLTLLVFHQEKSQVIEALHDLGVLHIEMKPNPAGEAIEKLEAEKNEWYKAIEILRMHRRDGFHKHRKIRDVHKLRDNLLWYGKEMDKQRAHLEALRREERQLHPWHGFHWENIERLARHGVMVTFYKAPVKEFQAFDTGNLTLEVVDKNKLHVRFVVFTLHEPADIPFDPVELPRKSLDEIYKQKAAITNKIRKLKRVLSSWHFAIPALRAAWEKANDQLHYEMAGQSFEGYAEDKIWALTGWFPTGVSVDVEGFLEREKLTYTIERPNPKDTVPVRLKNKKYTKLYETITKIFQLPNYYEFDLTPFIAVFYPIFFAYCLGDAGYGVVLVLFSIIAAFTFLKNMKSVAALGLVLGVVTTAMGIVKSGSVFGIPVTQHTDIPLFQFLSRYIIVPDDHDYLFNAFNVSLMIGVVQIFTGVITSIVKQISFFGFRYGLKNIGKFLILLSVMVLFLGGMQDMAVFVPYLEAAWVIFVAGIVLVLFFHDPDTPLLRRIGGGFLPLYFIFTGFLGDVLSYIRLFALGAASSILGLVVNQIGMGMMEGAGILGIAGAVLFLVFGHSLNFALATLGAFVHPLRLTFVEFYSNAEFKGGGVPYQPFRKEVMAG